MCGLVGIFSNNSIPVPEDDIIRKMADSIAHRGPDDEGIFKLKSPQKDFTFKPFLLICSYFFSFDYIQLY